MQKVLVKKRILTIGLGGGQSGVRCNILRHSSAAQRMFKGVRLNAVCAVEEA